MRSSRALRSAASTPRAATSRFSATDSEAKMRRPSMQCEMPRARHGMRGQGGDVFAVKADPARGDRQRAATKHGDGGGP
jgi:hypothetical protein